MFKPRPEPTQPTDAVPVGLNQTRRYGGVLMVAGQGPKPAGIALVFTAPSEHEASDSIEASETMVVQDRAKYLKGPCGIMLKDVILSAGLDTRQMYVTSLIKWLLPKAKRYSPSADAIALARDCLHRELDEAKPGIIIAFGKPAFEALVDVRMPFNDIIGGVFWSERHRCRVMPLESPFMLEKRPDYIERYRIYFRLVLTLIGHDQMKPLPLVPTEYQVVETEQQLRDMVTRWVRERWYLFAVDCEWKGSNHIDGELRSIQFCWKPGVASYVRFMDDQGNYVFPISYAQAGQILAEWLDQPVVQYVGHHISADLPWMHHVLGLKWYQKTAMDTEFAQQTADEHAPTGLEWLAVKDTDLGRYDIELDLYKKANKIGKDEGYWRIPDSIMIPYALKDVDTTMRAYYRIYRDLEHQGLLEYYTRILNPFCTDVFTNFVILGLPMDIPKMDELRDLYGFSTEMMSIEFQRKIRTEAAEMLRAELCSLDSVRGDWTATEIEQAETAGDHQEAHRILGRMVAENHPQRARCELLLAHFLEARGFNIRSKPMMTRWLFDVKRYTPVKSTGKPSMSWEKILTYPPDRQKEYSPAADRQTIQILSEQYDDELLRYLLQLNAIGNIRKGLLKEPTIDDETGEITRENGLHYWLCKDMRIHGQLSLTETARPRSWHPNTLNWSSYVLEQIELGMRNTFTDLHSRQELPEKFQKYLDKNIQIPSIRSCVTAPPGWCLVESDFVTAEIRGLAYISGDQNLISLLNDPDTNFAETNDGKLVRIGFDGSGISHENMRPEFCLAYWEEGEFKIRYGFNDLKRAADGGLVHPRFDLHWSLAEGWQQRPREMMKKETDRKAGKVGNFSTAYGATANSINRKIEADTGVKPPPDTGEKILAALEKRQPVAFAFLRSMEEVQFTPGFYRAASGRIRHFSTHPQWAKVGRRTADQLASGQGREARNYPMQESVGATAARACTWLLRAQIKAQLQSRIGICLYDSCDTWAPLRERFIQKRLHEYYMTDVNTWQYGDRTLQYPIETEFNVGWSARPSKTLRKLWDDPEYENDPVWNKQVLASLGVPE